MKSRQRGQALAIEAGIQPPNNIKDTKNALPLFFMDRCSGIVACLEFLTGVPFLTGPRGPRAILTIFQSRGHCQNITIKKPREKVGTVENLVLRARNNEKVPCTQFT